MARAQRLQGDAEVAAASVRRNPDLVVQHQRSLSGPEDRETIVGLSVPLGIGGRRSLLKDAASARRDHAQAAASATVFDASVMFRRAYAQAALDGARLDVVLAQQRALESLSDTIKALAEGGESAPYDLLRQQTQARLYQRKVASMRARAASSRQWLAAWAGDKIAADGPDLLSLAGGPRTLRVASAPRSGWSHPRVRSLEAASRTNTLEAKAARRRWVPDLELFAGYRTVAGAVSMGHGISLGLTVPLTFFDYGQGEAQRADAKSRFAEAKASRLRRAHTARMSAEAARLAELEKGLAALDQMVRDGLTLRKKARLLYSADEASIAELLDAYRVTEAVHQARIDAIEEILNARLEVMSAAGTHFNTALDKACGASPRRGPR